MDFWHFLIKCEKVIMPECWLVVVVVFKHSGVDGYESHI